MVETRRFRGILRSQGRIVIRDDIRKLLDLNEGEFFEGEVLGDKKILITFIKVGD